MKMLLVVDKERYSDDAALEAAQIAANTWAEVTVLGLQEQGAVELDAKLVERLVSFQRAFLDFEGAPYRSGPLEEAIKLRPDLWELSFAPPGGRKPLRIVVRRGKFLDEIMKQVKEDETDFLVLGLPSREEFQWAGYVNLPYKVASKAPCNVLLVKRKDAPKSVVCCLDHDYVSQESLELINQFVTIHDAELTIVGIAPPKGLKENVEEKMDQILQYYVGLGIRTWVKLVDEASLGGFVAEASRRSIVGLWMGKKSFLKELFAKDRLEELIDAARSLLLILK